MRLGIALCILLGSSPPSVSLASRSRLLVLCLLLPVALLGPGEAAAPAADDVRSALLNACEFYATACSRHGGYVYRYSGDLTLSEGEAETDAETIWVQPPGTPTVGEAFLDAFDATGDRAPLEAAAAAGRALVAGQMQSGGWDYSIAFDPVKRQRWGYVGNASYRRRPNARGRDDRNITTLDDDTTPAALRFLIRLDDRLDGRDARITAAARRAADAIATAQRANGGWPQNWSAPPVPDRQPPAPAASFPEEWSRTWGNDWPGRYTLNDDVAGQTIRAMLDAADHFGEPRYRDAAIAGGLFLKSARLPEPQPGWAQQYDENMHPCWDRKFEPPALSSEESQDAIRILIELADRTGRGEFLDDLGSSVRWLRDSEIAPGRLARFYELQTNRPLYFDRQYQLTYEPDDLPTHYAFQVDSQADALWTERLRVKNGKPKAISPIDDNRVRECLSELDDRGAWVNPDGNMRGFGKARRGGTIESAVFAANVALLSRWLVQADQPGEP